MGVCVSTQEVNIYDKRRSRGAADRAPNKMKLKESAPSVDVETQSTYLVLWNGSLLYRIISLAWRVVHFFARFPPSSADEWSFEDKSLMIICFSRNIHRLYSVISHTCPFRIKSGKASVDCCRHRLVRIAEAWSKGKSPINSFLIWDWRRCWGTSEVRLVVAST